MGSGHYTWSDGSSYEGFLGTTKQDLKDNKGVPLTIYGLAIDGTGRYVWKDNSVYQGNWKEGLQEGQGWYHDDKGNDYRG